MTQNQRVAEQTMLRDFDRELRRCMDDEQEEYLELMDDAEYGDSDRELDLPFTDCVWENDFFVMTTDRDPELERLFDDDFLGRVRFVRSLLNRR